MARVLSLDLGTSSVRAIVHDERGLPVGKPVEVEWRPLRSGGGRVEFDLHRVAAAVDETVQQGLRHEDVDAVGASCFWHSLAVLDARGEVASPLLTWRDSRAEREAGELAARLDADAVHRRTGCPIHASFWPAKVLWFRRHQPELAAGGRFVSVSDVALEEPATSLSLASGTGFLNRETCSWDEELLDAVGVDAAQLPTISDELHERAGRPWFPAIGDGAAANLGSGAVGPTVGGLTIGTSGALRIVREGISEPPRPGLFQLRVDRRRVIDGGSIADGGLLRKWLAHTLRLPTDQGEEEILERSPGSHGLVFLTLLGGDRAPGWSPNAAGAITGLTAETSALDLRHAALEGVAFRFAEILERLPEVERLLGSGGTLRKSTALCQILADVLGLPLELPQVEEASARGAALFAFERLGVEPSPATVERVFEPRRDRADAIAEARHRDRELYRTVVG